MERLRTGRIDYFLVWNHGIKYIDNILALIRKEFPIIRIQKLNARDFEDIALCNADIMYRFVKRVYSSDTVPYQHLMSKTQYLSKLDTEFYIILVNNKSPNEQIYGEGQYAHIQCSKIKTIKEEIRNFYNPKKDGNRTEEHVVHASDYESQTNQLLSYLRLPSIQELLYIPNLRFNVPYHVGPLEKYEILTVPKDKILWSFPGGKTISLKETPHYIAAHNQNVDEYVQYFQKVKGIYDLDDHCVENFEKLKKTYSYTERNYAIVEKTKYVHGFYRIIDGVHRLSIDENDEIPVIVKQQFPNQHLNLASVFNKIKYDYVILRQNSYFPQYYDGQDIDILCRNKKDFVQILQLAINTTFAEKGYSKQIYTITEENGHAHLDLHPNLDDQFIRFDIIEELDYGNIVVNPIYKDIILSRLEEKNYDGFKVKVPCKEDDLAIRCLEFITYPEKLKHLATLYSSDDVSFFEALRHNTNLDIDKLWTLLKNELKNYGKE